MAADDLIASTSGIVNDKPSFFVNRMKLGHMNGSDQRNNNKNTSLLYNLLVLLSFCNCPLWCFDERDVVAGIMSRSRERSVDHCSERHGAHVLQK